MIDPGTILESNPSVFGAAIQGARADQQDSFRTRRIESEGAWLLVLADGMGGHAGGAIASKIGVDAFVASFVSLRGRGAALEDALRSSLADVNRRIARTQALRPDLTGMGTTLVAAYVSRAGVSWVSVGDSPMWLLRDGALERLNEDHSVRDSLDGKTQFLQSALNGGLISLVDCHHLPLALRSGDSLLIASDGIFTLRDLEIVDVMQPADACRRADELVEALLDNVAKRGKASQDNCCAIVATCFEQSDATADGHELRPATSPTAPVRSYVILSALALAGLLGLWALWILDKL
jgi:PPM family protein phosphatase